MFARMASFSVTDPSAVMEMAERIREAAQPIVESLDGWQGATQMIDRENGKLVVIHMFDSEENMRASEPTFETMPERFPEELRDRMREIAGGRQSVERFQVLAEARSPALM